MTDEITTRNLRPASQVPGQADAPPDFRRSLAVVIGIDGYKKPIPELKTPGNDARRVAEVLEDQQKYRVLELLTQDVTRDRLITLFSETLPALNLGRDDRLLVYFAGHGTVIRDDRGEPEYYLIAQNEEKDGVSTGISDSLLPMRQVRDELLKLECRHLLVVLDCCFAGGFGRMRSFEEPPPKIYRQRYDFYVRSPAWQVIASAAYDETALDTAGGYVFGRRFAGEEPDNSPFADALFAALSGQADVNPPAQEGAPEGDGLITAAELYQWVRDRVQSQADAANHRQSPGLWPLPNHQAGEYVFRNPERALSLDAAPPLTPDANPYRGLSSYDEKHSHLFFGRAKQIEALAGLVARPPFVAVLGASGTGKSSLAKAGLIPALGGSHGVGEPPDPRPAGKAHWLVLPPFRPTAEPVAALAKLLADHLPAYVSQAPPLASDPAALAAVVTAWHKDHADGRLVLVIDQFEELVTLCGDPEQRQHFQALLGSGLADGGDALRVAVTLRTDFEPQFSHGPLEAYWNHDARFVVPPMSQDDLRQVILGPAWATELYFDPHTLVDELINEVVQAPGGLPLLSFALSEMVIRYFESHREDRTLQQEDYNKVGGVIGSLRAPANKIWDDLDPAHQATMQRLMLRMVALEGGEVARRRVACAELDYGAEENTRRDEVIGRLEAARLVVKDENARWVEPAHDALVSGWDKLMEWKLKAASVLPLQRELAPVALRWQAAKSEGKTGLLWDDNPQLPRLEATLWPVDGKRGGPAGWARWLKQILWPNVTLPSDTQWLNAPEARFVQASVVRRASTLKRVVTITAIVILALAGLALFAARQASEATVQRDNAVHARQTADVEVVVRTTAEANLVAEVVVRATAEADARLKQAEAQREARRSKAGELAVQAQNAMTNNREDPSLALLLAIQAGEVTWRTPEHIVVANAYKALWDAIEPWRMTLVRLRNPDTSTYPYGPGPIKWATFSPDSKRIVVAIDDTARIWDTVTRQELLTLSGHTSGVNSASYSPDGQHIVTASRDYTVRIWDAATGREMRALSGGANSAAYSPDGRFIVAASGGWTARIWDAATGQAMLTLSGHGGPVTSVAYSPECESPPEAPTAQCSKLIVTASEDGTARIWNSETGLEIQSLKSLSGHTGYVSSATFSPDGKQIITASKDRTARIWDVDTGKEVQLLNGHSASVNSALFSPDGKQIVTASGGWTAFRSILSGQGIPYGGEIPRGADDETVRVWNAVASQEERQLTGHTGRVTSVAYSPDSRQIVTASEDTTACIWDAATGQELRQLTGHTGGC